MLYLFEDESLGGTNFYDLTSVEAAQAIGDANTLSSRDYAAKYGIQPGYIGPSNDCFKRVGHVPAHFNRMIVYDGSMLHSSDIPHPEKLSADPASGRLTLNGFFTCRRQAI